MRKNTKKYDVVILTHAPHDEFILSLTKLLEQSILPEKIVVINTDKKIFYKNIANKKKLINLLANSHIMVKHITEKSFDHGKTRNVAQSFCKSPYIMFLTDDAIPYDRYLAEHLLEGFTMYNTVKSKVAVTYARQLPKDTASLKEKLIRDFNYPEYDIVKEKAKEKELGIKNYFCSNVCAMYDKTIFEKLGKFEEEIILNEDTFFVYNAINKGFRVVYKNDAKVIHSHNLTYKEQFSRNFDIGVSQKEHHEIFDKINSEKEGMKLFKHVAYNMARKMKFIDIIDFGVECIYRYFGYKFGYNYEKLSNEQCINYATNKKYFKQMKK